MNADMIKSRLLTIKSMMAATPERDALLGKFWRELFALVERVEELEKACEADALANLAKMREEKVMDGDVTPKLGE